MAIPKQVTLETVTPLFLGGSNPRGEPELRAPSFRGAMRFWLRALLGGVIGDDLKKIFEHESQVFGSTDHASPVVVRVSHQNLRSIGYSRLQNHPGIAYLFFGARQTRSEPERKAIADGCQFPCTFHLRRAGVQNPKALQAALAALWLLTNLGGLGMRARRGGGNLQVVSTDWDDPLLPPLTVHAQTPEQLQKELQDGLHRLRKWAAETFNGSLSPTFQAQPTFDVLHPDWCSIAVVKREFANWSDALNEFGQAMQQLRRRYDPVQRAAFGLPIVFYFRSPGGERATLEGEKDSGNNPPQRDKRGERATLKGEKHDRRASPLLVRVTKLASGKCALVLIRFRSPLLPAGEQLQLRYRERNEERKVYTDQPSGDLLGDFLRHLSQQVAPLLEVTGW